MLTEEQLAEIVGKYPGAVHLVAPDKSWEAVVRAPTRPEFKRYRKRLHDPVWRADAVEEMITDCVVYPDRAGFQVLLDRFPAACEGIAAIDAVAEMMGLRVSALAK